MQRKSKTRPRRSFRPGIAAKRLQEFIDRNEIKVTKAANDLACTHPALISWLSGRSVPTARFRKNIAIWTSDEVPEQIWLTKDDARSIDEVKPFRRRTGTDGE